MINHGRISLIGAGPGAPECLSINAIKAITQADVILIDDLVNPKTLSHACVEARIVKVGKRGSYRSTPEAFIERLMIAEAHMGRNVVRLKSDVPSMPGHGGEEREHLQRIDIGIEVDVINGMDFSAPSQRRTSFL